MSDNNLHAEEEAKIAAAREAYDAAVEGKMPADENDLEGWQAFDELDRKEFAKYHAVVNEVNEARKARS